MACRQNGDWRPWIVSSWRAVESTGDSRCDNGPAAAGRYLLADEARFERMGDRPQPFGQVMRASAGGHLNSIGQLSAAL